MWVGCSGTKDFDTESGEECLVTDIAHELSLGLENPSLLAESISLFDHDSLKDESVNALPRLYSCDFINEFLKRESVDLEIESEDIFVNKSELSSGHGSGSETSSIEQHWSVKNEMDTPPTTPPDADDRVSPESVCLIPSTEFAFYPVPVSGVASSRSRCKPRLKTIAAKGLSTRPDILSSKAAESSANVVAVSGNEDAGPVLKKYIISKEDLQKQQAKRRQERMIRNRESAYLSRKRKKEHVSLLEKQAQDLLLENQKLRLENSELRERLRKYEPWHANKQTWRRLADIPRKTTALLALVVTVCINIGSLSGVLDSGQLSAQKMQMDTSPSNHLTRSLLWTDPLDEVGLSNLTTSCPVAINQSESIRLERDLRRWIVGDKGLWHRPKPEKSAAGTRSNVNNRKKRAFRTRKAGIVANAAINMFNINPHLVGLESLYEAIHRRADTFYLVSFSADHLLLPAIARNQTSRPKISVMLPSLAANSSNGRAEHVEMMQIDCEVTNTQLLSVRGDDIPSHMRNVPKYSNTSVKPPDNSDTFQDFEISEQTESFLINLNKRANFSTIHPKHSFKPYPVLSRKGVVGPPKNQSLPELVSPYINGSVDSQTRNGTLVTKSSHVAENRPGADFDIGYRDEQLILRGGVSPQGSNVLENVNVKPLKNLTSYARLFNRG